MLDQYPASLPVPLKGDRDLQMVDPLVATPFDNGQTRWDRQYTDVPATTPVSWILTDAQSQAFQAWYRDVLNFGVKWFAMPLRSPTGRNVEECHFVRGYSGPRRKGFNRWQIDAQLMLRRMPLPPMGEGLFPDDIVYSELFDLTINKEWPTA